MNRRLFLKTMGLGSIGIASAGYLMANNNFITQNKVVEFPPEELKSSLTQYINRYFNGELFNPNEPLPNGIILVADGFEVVPVVGKNNIFDIADIVIERCKSIGFDASNLKKGEIPNGMEVNNGGIAIRTQEVITFIKIEDLVDYDATIRYHNGFLIISSLPPVQWNTVNKINRAYESKHGSIYMDKKEMLTIKLSPFDKKEHVKVQALWPSLSLAPEQSFRVPISKDIVMPFLNKETIELIFNKPINE
ncbi:MAG: hypothetical protein N4A71_10880 [Carboxylicivirga sp.]|jgi:hypothetical protein|nr:hypothetical protein [Carboxylicivirga sp.]